MAEIGDIERRERDSLICHALSKGLVLFGEEVQRNKIAKGWTVTTKDSWRDDNQIPADLALIHSEVSEALEAFRKDDREGFAEELADVLIRLVGLAHGMEIDIAGRAVGKAAKNRIRPFQHGGKRL